MIEFSVFAGVTVSFLAPLLRQVAASHVSQID